MKIRILILIIVINFFVTSCGTIFTGTRDNITFNTNPSGAIVYIDGVE
jgi:hypothetical protein